MQHIRRTPDTVRRWAKRGILRSAGRLPDGGWLFRIEDVEALDHLLTDPVVQFAPRKVLAEVAPERQHPRREAGGA